MKKYAPKENRILIVDDEPEIVELLKHYLSAKGYRVNGALSGEEALSILSREDTDLLLLDIKMPGIQGTEVAKIVKDKYPQIKIIVVTGYGQEAEGLLESKLLAGLFTKPVQPQKLYKRISEILFYPEMTKAVLWVKTMALLAIRDILAQNFKNN